MHLNRPDYPGGRCRIDIATIGLTLCARFTVASLADWGTQAVRALSLAHELSEDSVRFLQRLFAPDIIPSPLDLIGLYRKPSVEPLDKTSRLIRIIPGCYVGRKKFERCRCEIIKCDAGKSRFRFFRLLLET